MVTEYTVSVEKRMYSTGAVKVYAANPDQAIELIQNRIDRRELQTTAVEWDGPQYEDCSFSTTGYVY